MQQSGEPETIDNIFQDAIRCHQNGDIQNASILYNKVLGMDENHADSHHLLGVIAYEQREYPLSESLILKAISLRPDIPLYHSNLGLVYEGAGDHEKALNEYIKAADLDAGNADVSRRTCQSEFGKF